MNSAEAEGTLAESELIACAQAPLPEAKQLRDVCLEADIPVLLDRGDCCGQKAGGKGGGSCGCAPKMQLFARAEDVPRVSRLLHERWREMALREGTITSDHPALTAAEVAAEEVADVPLPRLWNGGSAGRRRLHGLRPATGVTAMCRAPFSGDSLIKFSC